MFSPIHSLNKYLNLLISNKFYTSNSPKIKSKSTIAFCIQREKSQTLNYKMESNGTVPQCIDGTHVGGGSNGVGNNDNESIQLPEQRAWQSSGLECSMTRGRRPLPPPFLLKIYDIVDDPNTNEMISWGPNKTSFIIFDKLKFTSELLCKYFTHNNFASFNYQLNNYGFKKISWEKYEYENPWFQAGKKEWLKYIKRRNQIQEPQSTLPQALLTSSDHPQMEIVEEIESLRAEQVFMKEEIQKLRGKSEELGKKFAAIQENASKLEEIIIQLVVYKLLQNVRKKREDICNETAKRQKLTVSGCIDSENIDISEQAADKGGVLRQNRNEKHQIQEELIEIQPEGQILSSPDDCSSCNQDDQANKFPGNAENCAYWKKMLEDDFETENQETEFAGNSPRFNIKLQDLMECNTVMEWENSIPNAIVIKVEKDSHSSSGHIFML